MLETIPPAIYDSLLPEIGDHLAQLLQLLDDLVNAGRLTDADYDVLEGATLKAFSTCQQATANVAYIKGQARMLERLALGTVAYESTL